MVGLLNSSNVAPVILFVISNATELNNKSTKIDINNAIVIDLPDVFLRLQISIVLFIFSILLISYTIVRKLYYLEILVSFYLLKLNLSFKKRKNDLKFYLKSIDYTTFIQSYINHGRRRRSK